jgi:hypothetical protein
MLEYSENNGLSKIFQVRNNDVECIQHATSRYSSASAPRIKIEKATMG